MAAKIRIYPMMLTGHNPNMLQLRSEKAVVDMLELALGIPFLLAIFLYSYLTFPSAFFNFSMQSAVDIAFRQVDPSVVSINKEPNFPSELNLCGLKTGSAPMICDVPAGTGGFFDSDFATHYLDKITSTIESNFTGSNVGPWLKIEDDRWAAQCAVVRSPVPALPNDSFSLSGSPPVQTIGSSALFAQPETANFSVISIATKYFNGMGINDVGWRVEVSPDPTVSQIADLPALYIFCSSIVRQSRSRSSEPYRYVNYWAVRPVDSFGGIQ